MNYRMIQEFSQALPGKTLAASGQYLVELAQHLGWQKVAFNADVSAAELPIDEHGSYLADSMDWPGDCLSRWESQRLVETCPVTQTCKKIQTPFYWSLSRSDFWDSRCLPQKQRNTLFSYGNFAEAAVTVPIHRPGGRTAYLSWFSNNDRKAKNLYQNSAETLFMISHSYVQWFDKVNETGRNNGASECQPFTDSFLTKRELECLTWAGKGKTEHEIALILGRSQSTSRFHLRNAIEKLNAANRCHAVAKACSMGLISVN